MNEEHQLTMVRSLLVAGWLFISWSLPVIVQAQLEWTLNNDPGTFSAWHLSGGVAFSVDEYIYFGSGVNNSGELHMGFYQYHPSTNTFEGYLPLPGIADPFTNGVAFSVGGWGFAGLGGTGGFTSYDKIYRKHAQEEFWDNTITFPGGPRSNAIAFVIGNKAYVGGGQHEFSNYNDLWEFDPANSSWTAKANMPAAISGGVAFSIAGLGYVQREGSANFWSFDPLANTWSTLEAYPGGGRIGATGFALNGKGYVGTGSLGGARQKDFFAFNPTTGSWEPAPPMWDAWGRTDAIGITHGGQAYVIGGKASQSNHSVKEIWALGASVAPIAGTWVQRPFLPAVPRERPISFVIGDMAYLGGGHTGFSNWLNDFWAYDPVARTWTAKAALPGTAHVGLALEGKGYVLLNTAAGNFWQYDPLQDLWSAKADMPTGARTFATGFVTEGSIFIGTGFISGTRMQDLWEYDPDTDTWEQKADMPGSAVHSAAGFAIGNKGYIVGGNINSSTVATMMLREYDPAYDTWTVRSSLYNVQNHMAFSIGNIGYVAGGTIAGNPLDLFRSYDPAMDTWTDQESGGGGWRYNGAGFSVGGRGFIACGQLNPNSSFPNSAARTNDLWEFVSDLLTVSPKVFLGGPFDPMTGMMSATLNSEGLIPETDPYGALGYPLPGGTYSDLGTQLPASSGNNTIVDRIIVELRDAAVPSTILASRHVWLQHDGDVVDMDGISPVRFNLPPGNYHVAIKHRNHLGVMTASGIALSSIATTVDFTQSSTSTYGVEAQKNVAGTMVLWPGDANFDGLVKYSGADNDRDVVLQAIGGSIPSNTLDDVYHSADLNLDGIVRYTGTGNDRDIILQTIGGVVPTNVRVEQVP